MILPPELAGSTPAARASFKVSIPLFRVTDVVAAHAFYCGQLGFELELAQPAELSPGAPAYLGLVRDGARLHLSSHSEDGVPGGVCYIIVDDVDAVFRELTQNGVTGITLSPTNQTWGMRELYVRDPDGNTVRYGAPV